MVDVVVGCLILEMCQGPVGVILRARREDHYFVVLGHLLEEGTRVGPD